ncbi:M14 family metallopeptidase [Aequorivita sp. SDUM287046]|uniref:M14 family metallopeptidase n=1 Tax=Aequorivita aurantiaca TaxID=3053356 RepID=A0ABT8DGU5_9FLAO|nr:M14 family metallopeptidase [Aequorivita aurantiaca]MDN3724601.1 M14 family metallopeptidase [Aequorivita aurantiaca]
MQKTIFFVIFIVFNYSIAQPIKTIFENSGGNQTATYQETIAFYLALEKKFPPIKVYEMGQTDSGFQLHVVIFDPENTPQKNSKESFSKNGKNLLLINNGIHPGEPDGIDATMLLLRDFAENKIPFPKNTIIATIPIYNIGGALNRNSTSRTNQNGPDEYGFRGNARNYDLNRDFIKNDTKNARAFAEIFHWLNPDLFIDNHVSNGADYQYVLTHLFTQHNKLGGEMGHYLHTSLMPQLEDSLQQKKWDITPYVNVFNQVPELGFTQFLDSPRYASGYTTLFNTFGLTVETHMLKPYKQRVEGTYALMKSFISIAEKDASKIKRLRTNAVEKYKVGSYYPLSWEVDSTKTSTLNFKGFEGKMVPSKITGSDRLKYFLDKPFVKDVVYYNYFKPMDSVKIPSAYIVPNGYWNVIDLLKLNNIEFSEIKNDSTISAEVYHIKSFETVKNPFEGHYLHYRTEVSKGIEQVSLKPGDIIIKTQQPGIRYLLETLEPSATDSFFNWNFFDAILQQKEGFSPYVWEDMAENFLNENPETKKEFEAKKRNDPEFSKNWYMQLDWIHKKSTFYEKSHLRYPIVRVGG